MNSGFSDSELVAFAGSQQPDEHTEDITHITSLAQVLAGVITEMATNHDHITSPLAAERRQFATSLIMRLGLGDQIFVSESPEPRPDDVVDSSVYQERGGRREILFPSTLISLLNEQYPRARRQLAEKIGITESALSQYTRGDATPKLPTLVNLADALGVSLDHLVFGIDT